MIVTAALPDCLTEQALGSGHVHAWRSTQAALGLVGSFYPNVYPGACECGALKRYDGVVLPGRLS